MSKLDDLFKDLNKEYKDILVQKGVEDKLLPRINFTSPRANWMLYGGVPRGRFSEFCGENGGGKTSSALDIVKNAQLLFQQEHDDEIDTIEERLEDTTLKKAERTLLEARLQLLEINGPLKILFVDVEHTLDCEWCQKLGVDTDEIYLFQPTGLSAEQILQQILEYMATGEIGLVILDSIPTLIPQAALGKTLEEKTYCGVAGPLTDFMVKAVPIVGKYNITFIGINHTKPVVGSMYHQLKTNGGEAWKYYCSVRILFEKGKFIDKNGDELKNGVGDPDGNLVDMRLLKSKIGMSKRRISHYALDYDNGINVVIDTIDLAVENRIIKKTGSWFEAPLSDDEEDIKKLQGIRQVVEFYQDEKELFGELLEKVMELVMNRG